jgi:23S rRNA (guanosine2251-2'-O)-methyltransferase
MSDSIEGRNPVLEALKSERPLNKILLARDFGQHSAVAEIIQLAKARNIPVERVTKEVVNKLSMTGVHQGIIAFAAAKEYISLEELFAISREKNQPPLYCILDGIEDPHNLGAIIRTAEASAIHGVIIRSRREVGLTASVAKASSGAIEYMPVARVTNISQTIEILKRLNIWSIGIDPTGKVNYTEVDFTLPTAFIIGGEGKGISELVKKRCDYLVSIPMRGRINSLNASTAAAIVMYEALKQRGKML